MAPVAGRITNTDDQQFVLFFSSIQRRLAPGIPVDRILRMLPEVRAGFIPKMVETGLGNRVLPCPDQQKQDNEKFPEQSLILIQR